MSSNVILPLSIVTISCLVRLSTLWNCLAVLVTSIRPRQLLPTFLFFILAHISSLCLAFASPSNHCLDSALGCERPSPAARFCPPCTSTRPSTRANWCRRSPTKSEITLSLPLVNLSALFSSYSLPFQPPRLPTQPKRGPKQRSRPSLICPTPQHSCTLHWLLASVSLSMPGSSFALVEVSLIRPAAPLAYFVT